MVNLPLVRQAVAVGVGVERVGAGDPAECRALVQMMLVTSTPGSYDEGTVLVTQAAGTASGGGGSSPRGTAMSSPFVEGPTLIRRRFVQTAGASEGVKKTSSAPPEKTVPAGQPAESETPFVPGAMPVRASPDSAAGERAGAPAALLWSAAGPER